MLSFKIKPNSPILLLCLLVVVLLSGCSRRKATLDQSKKALKAFDYEMIQITKRLADTEAFEALMLIRRLPGIQLPFITSNDTIAGSGLSTFNMKRANGVYEYHSTDSLPEKISDSDSLIILYKNPKNQSKSYKLIVKSFHETLTDLGMVFPDNLDAEIYQNNHSIGKITLHTKFKHGIPATSDFIVDAGRIKAEIQMTTTFRRKKSNIELKFKLSEAGRLLIKAGIKSDVKKTLSNSLAYDAKNIELEVFPIKVEMTSGFCFSDKISENFFNDFNKNTKITLSDEEGFELGQVKLAQAPGRSRVNLIMYYNDGSTENLEDLLFSVRKILNMKTTMPH